MTTRWEYKVIEIGRSSWEDDVEAFNAEGMQGWEAVSVVAQTADYTSGNNGGTRSKTNMTYAVLMKRPC